MSTAAVASAFTEPDRPNNGEGGWWVGAFPEMEACGCWSDRCELRIRLLPLPALYDEPPFQTSPGDRSIGKEAGRPAPPSPELEIRRTPACTVPPPSPPCSA